MLGIAVLAGAAWWWQNRAAPAGAVQPAASGSGANPAAAQRTAAGGPTGPAGAVGPVSVEVGKVEAMTLEDDAQAVGSLRSRQGVVLRPEVSGRIASLGFSDGQRVRRGQLLVQLDDTLQQAQLKQAEAQASIARTNLQRNRELVAREFRQPECGRPERCGTRSRRGAGGAGQGAAGAHAHRRALRRHWPAFAASTWATTSRTAPTW